jgi:hypothetical protein
MNRKTHEFFDQLPPVFTHTHLNALLRKEGKTHTYLHRWSKSGWISPLGGKTGIYFKSQVKDEYFEDALAGLFPEAVLIGPSVMANNNLTTQLARVPNIAIRWRRSYPKPDGVHIFLRPKKWHLFIRQHNFFEPSTEGLPSITPEFALADMLKYKDSWITLAPDDIDLEEIDSDLFIHACDGLDVDLDARDLFLDQLSAGPSF